MQLFDAGVNNNPVLKGSNNCLEPIYRHRDQASQRYRQHAVDSVASKHLESTWGKHSRKESTLGKSDSIATGLVLVQLRQINLLAGESQQTALRHPIGVDVREKKQPWVFAALDPRLIALMPIGIGAAWTGQSQSYGRLTSSLYGLSTRGCLQDLRLTDSQVGLDSAKHFFGSID